MEYKYAKSKNSQSKTGNDIVRKVELSSLLGIKRAVYPAQDIYI